MRRPFFTRPSVSSSAAVSVRGRAWLRWVCTSERIQPLELGIVEIAVRAAEEAEGALGGAALVGAARDGAEVRGHAPWRASSTPWRVLLAELAPAGDAAVLVRPDHGGIVDDEAADRVLAHPGIRAGGCARPSERRSRRGSRGRSPAGARSPNALRSDQITHVGPVSTRHKQSSAHAPKHLLSLARQVRVVVAIAQPHSERHV